MMTAAMAFFSIALTLNLTGIKLTEMRAADFSPRACAPLLPGSTTPPTNR